MSTTTRSLAIAILIVGAALPFAWYGLVISPAGSMNQQLASSPTFRESPLYEQVAIVVTFFGVKFTYTIATAAIVFILRKRHEVDMVALRWSMIAFFIGEGFCFVNVMVYHDQSPLMEHLHSLGMVVSIAAGAYALIEGIDHRIVHYSQAGRCAFSGLCQGCIKSARVPCGLLRMFRWLLPMLAVLAALPLFSGFRQTVYNTRIFGAIHTYRHPLLHQIYELRYLPVAGMVLLLASFMVALRVDRPDSPRLPAAKVLMAAAMGAVAFSWFRLILVASFVDNQVWFASWEELLELISIAMVGSTLFVFRRRLLNAAEARSA